MPDVPEWGLAARRYPARTVVSQETWIDVADMTLMVIRRDHGAST